MLCKEPTGKLKQSAKLTYQNGSISLANLDVASSQRCELTPLIGPELVEWDVFLESTLGSSLPKSSTITCIL